MSTLEIRVLGPPTLHLNGQMCTVRSHKALALLCVLALDGPTLRSTLATLLWQRQQRQALHNVRNALLALRHDLGEAAQVLEADRHAVWLRDGSYSLDAHAVPLCSPEELCHLWRGSFLQGLQVRDSPPFEEWASQWEAQLVAGSTDRALTLAGEALPQKNLLLTEQLAQLVLKVDPLAQQAAALLVHAQREAGRIDVARQSELAFSRRYQSELGDAPDLRLPPRRASSSPPARPHTLPQVLTSFVGREPERAHLLTLLGQPGRRLITLHGLGGVGKTRLALEVARDAADRFDASFFVPLDDLMDPARIPVRIAQVTGLPLNSTDDPLADLAAGIGERKWLLILDNCEQFVGSAALLTRLLLACPHLTLLVTSREALQLKAEHLVTLTGLRTHGDALPEAARLFLDRATQVNHQIQNEANPALVRALTEAAGGLPLALELLASLTGQHSLEALATPSRGAALTLESPWQDVRARHRSVQAAFEHSWLLLPAEDRGKLARLSVFEGGFTLEAALAVTHAGPALLQRFVARSLLEGPRAGRYRLHPLLHEYLRAKLRAVPGEPDATCRAHARYYLAHIHARNTAASGAASPDLLEFVCDEESNLRALVAFLMHQGEFGKLVSLAEPLMWFYPLHGRMPEGLRTFEQLVQELPVGDPQGQQARRAFLASHGLLCLFIGHLDRAVELLTAAADTAEGDPLQLTRALDGLGQAHYRAGQFGLAVEPLARAVQLARTLNDPVRLLRTLNDYALALALTDQPHQAEDVHAEARTLHTTGQVPLGLDIVWLHTHHGLLAMLREQPGEALGAWNAAIGAAQAVNTPGLIPVVQALKALVMIDDGLNGAPRPEAASQADALCRAFLPVTEASGEQFAQALLLVLQGRLEAWRGDLRLGLQRVWAGLGRACDTHNGMVVQLALPVLISLLAQAGQAEEAGLLIGRVLHGPDTTAWLRTRARRCQAGLRQAAGQQPESPQEAALELRQVLSALRSRA